MCILGPPTLFIRPQPQTKLETDEVVFLCLALAVPVPIVTWSFKGENISDGGRFQIGREGILFGSLTITNIMFEDQGMYTCTFSNQHGSVEAFTELTVQGIGIITLLDIPFHNYDLFLFSSSYV